MDENVRRGGCILLVFGTLLLLFGVLGFVVELSEKPGPGGIILASVFLLLGGAGIYFGWRARRKGKLAKSFMDLSASDFPGVDPQKFQDWKSAYLESRQLIAQAQKRGLWIVWPTIILVLLVRGLIVDAVFILAFIGWVLYMFLYVKPLGNRARELLREAGIDRAMLKRALSGQANELNKQA